MNLVGSSNKGRIVKQLAILLSIVLSILSLSACGTSVASDVAQGAVDVVAENDSTQVPTEPSPAEAEPSSEFVETDNLDDKASIGTNEGTAEEATVSELKMKIDGRELPVIWEDNESVHALTGLVSKGPITVEMSMYGGFEQVGPLGTSLPRDDVQTSTQAGDIVLYSGNQIVVFYGSNSWAYTRLGHIDLPKQEMIDLLSNGDVTITLE